MVRFLPGSQTSYRAPPMTIMIVLPYVLPILKIPCRFEMHQFEESPTHLEESSHWTVLSALGRRAPQFFVFPGSAR